MAQRAAISLKTRREFREFLVSWTKSEIANEFDSAGVRCDLEFEPPGITGERRTLVEQYYHTLDLTKPDDVERLLSAYTYILVRLDQERSLSFASSSQRQNAESALKNLQRWLQLDGYTFVDSQLVKESDLGFRKDYALDPTPLGHGGQAEVFRARHKSTNDIVAFKRILGNDTDGLGRFKREIDILRRFDHPNIMPILDVAADYTWFTMPLAEGDLLTLRSRLIEDRFLLRMLIDVATALEAAHSHDILHRDITPKNVLGLNRHGQKRWVLSDFGIARRRQGETTFRRTGTGQFMGTDGFAAPEAWTDAHRMTCQADIYSLGRLIAWAVTEQWPVPNLPLAPADGPWAAIIVKSTAFAPRDRHESVSELLRDLKELRLSR